MARISVLRRIEEKEKEEGKTREKWLLASWFSLDGDVDRPVILREINSYWLHTGIVKTLASRSPPSVLSLNYRQFVVHRLILFNRRPIFPALEPFPILSIQMILITFSQFLEQFFPEFC